MQQAIRVTVTGEVPNDLEFVLKEGDTPVSSGTGATLLVPEVTEPRRLTLEVRDAAGLVGAAPITVTPQRKWNVFVVHHSHLDIGYTDPQGTVLRHHLDYVDAALRLAAETERLAGRRAVPLDGRVVAARTELAGGAARRVRGQVRRTGPRRHHRGDGVPVPAAHRGVLDR